MKLSTREARLGCLLLVSGVVMLTHTACYNQHFISKTQLEKLESAVDHREDVSVIIDNCDSSASASSDTGVRLAEGEGGTDTAATASSGDAAVAAVEGIDPETGCPVVTVDTASPMRVVTVDGERRRVTPFNFAVTDTQLVSPDYDLLLPIDQVSGAEVQISRGWKTGLFIGGVASAGAASFVLLLITAGDERGLGQQ